MKISELQTGQACKIALAAIAVNKRETKAKKPYLSLELFDGTDKITGNYWDWLGKNAPDINTVLDITGKVTEWQGSKQLTITGITVNKELPIESFMPKSGYDITAVYNEACAIGKSITDPFLRQRCLDLLGELDYLWLKAPGAVIVHHAYVAGTLIHSTSVARIARAMAEQIPGANVDLATAGGLLHDLGKLFGYRINGIVCEMTDVGMLYDHLFMGAEIVGNHVEADGPGIQAKLEMLRHIILSHHGSLEHGAVVTPASIEAHIVFHADSVDAAAEMVRDASRKVTGVKWSDKIWALNNRPHLTTEYVQEVMASDSSPRGDGIV